MSVTTTHRCASGVSSPCSGTTTACGVDEPYRLSDPAHNTDAFYDQFSRVVADAEAAAVTVQIHGCGSSACPWDTNADVAARVSVGSKDNLDSNAISNRMKAALLPLIQYVEPTTVVRSCNDVADDGDEELCATGNVQGRYINGQTAAPCGATADATADSRFLHVECSRDLRDTTNAPLGPDMVVAALTAVLNPQ